ncbi:hypothetical protein J2Y03_005294 [Neobacillus niacini]|nr:hypothetical protein [Neobacillus niacini]
MLHKSVMKIPNENMGCLNTLTLRIGSFIDNCRRTKRIIETIPAINEKMTNGYYEDGEEPVESLRLAVQMMNVGAFTSELY